MRFFCILLCLFVCACAEQNTSKLRGGNGKLYIDSSQCFSVGGIAAGAYIREHNRYEDGSFFVDREKPGTQFFRLNLRDDQRFYVDVVPEAISHDVGSLLVYFTGTGYNRELLEELYNAKVIDGRVTVEECFDLPLSGIISASTCEADYFRTGSLIYSSRLSDDNTSFFFVLDKIAENTFLYLSKHEKLKRALDFGAANSLIDEAKRAANYSEHCDDDQH